MFRQIIDAIQPRHLGLAGLCLLAWAWLHLFRYDAYGIEEAAALDLLLNWSIVHQIASPVALFGTPDLRALLFILLDLHWAGSLPAAKVFTMLVLFAAALMLARWGERELGSEATMIAGALFMLSPIAFMQTDHLGSGVYLLAAMACVPYLERLWLESRFELSSWLFLLALIAGFAVSLHPMGLAVPGVLLWKAWRMHADEPVRARNLMIAVGAFSLLMLIVRFGWYGIDSAANPLVVLGDALAGPSLLHPTGGWALGFVLADLLAIVFAVHLWQKRSDSLSLMLIGASLLGLVHADHAWTLIAWASLLYLGIPLFIQAHERLAGTLRLPGLAGRRGLVLIAAMLVVMLETGTARAYITVDGNRVLHGQARVLDILAREASDVDAPFVAASQWPARTLLACRRDVLPLPPLEHDANQFARDIEGLTHLVFDPNDPAMKPLARNAAALSHRLETVALLPDGVVLRVRKSGASGKP